MEIMIVGSSFSEDIQIVCFGGVADRGLGATTSRGYASDVPSYFRRVNPTNSYEKKDTLPVSDNETPKIKSIDDIEDEEVQGPSNPGIGKIEKLLDKLGNLVTKYHPFPARKPLVYRVDFLEFQRKIELFLQNTPLGNETTDYYRTQYAEIVELANEKCKEIIELKDKRKEKPKDDNQ